MTNNKIGVGVIGASLNGSWGGIAHIPALQALPQYHIAAVSSTRAESARDAALHFGVPHSFTDAYELASHPDVDLVTISVKVPDHVELVQTALSAGKMVLCEFPLARSTDEALTLTARAEKQQIRHFTGLQARANAAIRYVKDLIAEEYIGTIHAVHCNYSRPNYPYRSKQIQESHKYLLNNENGANQLTITAGHMLDALLYLFGSFSDISAMLDIHAKQVSVMETGEIIQATSPDHIAINGHLNNGAILSLQVRSTHVGSLFIEINGSKGDLILQSEDNGMVQWDVFTIKEGRTSAGYSPLEIPPKYVLQPAELPFGPAYNMAGLYQLISDDLTNQTHLAPDFHTALATHKLIDVVQKAAESGMKQPAVLVI